MLRPLNDCYCALRVQGLVELVTHRIFYSWWKWFGLTRSRDQCFDSRNVVLAFVGQGPIGVTHRVSQGTSWVIRMVCMLTCVVLRTYVCDVWIGFTGVSYIPIDGICNTQRTEVVCVSAANCCKKRIADDARGCRVEETWFVRQFPSPWTETNRDWLRTS